MKMQATDPDLGMYIGEVEVTTHKRGECAGEYCVIHRPSDHHMKDWPMVCRFDRYALIERLCEHGIGHPDPDSLAFFVAKGFESMGVHGCDGCCSTGD